MSGAFRREVGHHVEVYLREMAMYSPAQRAAFDAGAEDLFSHGSDAFRACMPDQIAFVSAEVATEDRLSETLEQLEAQVNHSRLPVSVVLNANYVEDSPHETTVRENLDTIRRFQKARPQIPLSYFVHLNQENVSIGGVRDTTSGAAIVAYRQRAEDRRQPVRDILLTSWDADTVGATPTYFRGQQEAYDRSTVTAWMGYPRLRHERLAPAFRAANYLLAWFDESIASAQASAPAAFSVNLGAFAIGRGFRGAESTEQGRLWRNVQYSPEVGRSFDYVYLPYGEVTVSSRRLEEQMGSQERLRYPALRTASDRSFLRMGHDVMPGKYFETELGDRVGAVYAGAHADYLYTLRHGSQNLGDEYALARGVAMAMVRNAAVRLGHVYNSAEVIEKALSLVS